MRSRRGGGGGGGGAGSRARHHTNKEMGPPLGPVSMGTEQRAVCSGGLVVEVEAEVLLKLGLSPSRVEEVIDELLHHGGVHLRMANDKECGRALLCPKPSARLATETWKIDF